MPASTPWLINRDQRAPLTGRNRQKKTNLIPRIGTWNVRTLMDNAHRPQRRTALVELGRYCLQIAALGETRFAVEEVGAGYIFFWSRRKSEERRETGIGVPLNRDMLVSFQDCQNASMAA